MYEKIPCVWMRGGTSKGAYFLAEDLPDSIEERNALLLNIMGSPDARQIDGIGGADPLTSKVAIVSRSTRQSIDVDYLFLQVFVDKALVSSSQNCGNILAGVAPFAIEKGLVASLPERTDVRIFMENTGQTATLSVSTPNGQVSYMGDTLIDGVPKPSSAIPVAFENTQGSSCGTLLPTGNAVDIVYGHRVTCIDNGMPTVILDAHEFGLTGTESREDLESNQTLKTKLEKIRLTLGPRMNLGDVADKSVPKLSLVSAAQNGGAISTRTFIPHRCHASIGVLGGVSVATACLIPASVAAEIAQIEKQSELLVEIEHPTGSLGVMIHCDDYGDVTSSAILRTARKLFEGWVFPYR